MFSNFVSIIKHDAIEFERFWNAYQTLYKFRESSTLLRQRFSEYAQ